MRATCPVCDSSQHEDVLSIPRLPVLVNAQVRPEHALEIPRANMDLAVCVNCGHLFNRSFDAGLLDYDAAYENTLHYSLQFQKFATALADRLVTTHHLVGARVGELGSGPGHFLSMLCEAGVGEALGWDPSYDVNRLGAYDGSAFSISNEMFPGDGSVPMSLAFSQHVLEHLDDPVAALAAQRAAVADTGGLVYSEVPNGQLMIERCALWDLVYEHVSYFVPTSLEFACRRAGLRVTSSGTSFGDQFLWCEAVAGSVDAEAHPEQDVVGASVLSAREFGIAALSQIAQARDDLARWASQGPVVVWGAGSKGMTFLNLVSDVAPVAGVVDINPRKVGWGVPGTSLVISGPESVAEIRPSIVLAANPVYVDEISAQLTAYGVEAEVRPLWG